MLNTMVLSIDISYYILYCFVILIPFPFLLRTCFIYQAEFVLIHMVHYWPNFSHLFLYAGVYCILSYLYLYEVTIQEDVYLQTFY